MMTFKVVRKPFHEALIKFIEAARESDLPALKALIGSTIIPDKHSEIVKALEVKVVTMPHLRQVLSEIQHLVLAQATEAQQRVAEKANQVTDAEKATALMRVIRSISNWQVQTGGFGPNPIPEFCQKGERIYVAKSRGAFAIETLSFIHDAS
jgi:hypothetical protein